MFGRFRRGAARATRATGRGLGFTWHLVVLVLSLVGLGAAARVGPHAVDLASDSETANRWLWVAIAVIVGVVVVLCAREAIWRAWVLVQRWRRPPDTI